MASAALTQWQGPSRAALDEVARAHRLVARSGPGQRLLNRQLTYAYVALLAAEFQAFCRELHTEAAVAIAAVVADRALAFVVKTSLTRGRQLDRGNPTPGHLGADFGRFGFGFWAAVDRHHAASAGRRQKLETLCAWRNAIVHADAAAKHAAAARDPRPVTLSTCTSWRRALDALATSFDAVVAEQCEDLGRPRPW
jgi:hypothetical protein